MLIAKIRHNSFILEIQRTFFLVRTAKLPIIILLVFVLTIQTANATAIYCLYDSKKNEFIVVADSKLRGYSPVSGETITSVTMQKWRILRNGALFAASGKYVEDTLNNKSIFDLAEDAVSPDMPFQKAAEIICNINIQYGILGRRNNVHTLFEAVLLGFVDREPRMFYFMFPPESQIGDKQIPYYIKDKMADSKESKCSVLGQSNVIVHSQNGIFNLPNIKDYLVSLMIKQIEEEPQSVGKPIDIIIISMDNIVKHERLE